MIERLILRDFKSHEDTHIVFNPGLNVFLGDVGAGKTSIFEGISFALFGRYAGSINQSGLIRRGSDEASVSLILSRPSGRYRIDRKIFHQKTQQTRMSVSDGGEWKLAVEGATAVSRSVSDILNVDSSTFLAAIYASQGEIKEMLETQPGNRRERLDKLLGIDMYERIWKTLGDARNIVLTELTQTQDKAGGLKILEQQLRELRARVVREKEELRNLKTIIADVEEGLKPVDRRLKELDDLGQRLTLVGARIEGVKREVQKSLKALEALRERHERAVEARRIYKKHKKDLNLERKLEEKKMRVENLLLKKKNLEIVLRRDKKSLKQSIRRQRNLEAQLGEVETLDRELKPLQIEREALPKVRGEVIRLEELLNERRGRLIKASSEIENQRVKVRRVTELGECPTCLQTIPEEHKERIRREAAKFILDLTSERLNLEEAEKTIRERLEEEKEKLERAEQADRRYLQLSTKVNVLKKGGQELELVGKDVEEIRSDIAETQRRISAIEETPESLRTIEESLEKVASKAELARDAQKLSASKEDLEAMLRQEEGSMEELEGRLTRLKALEERVSKEYDPKEHEVVEAKARELRERLAKAVEGSHRLEGMVKEDKRQSDRVEALLEDKREAQKVVERLRAENYLIETLRRSLRDVVQPVMRKNNVLRVSEAFKEFYQELSNDSIDYAAIDEEGNIEITRNGEPSPVNSLSGGEVTCASLALRLAICSSLTRNQLLLLDEPTIHLDELYRAKLRDFLSRHAFQQLIVVTHDNTFDSLPAKIFRVEKTGMRSVVRPGVT